ncbi:unnamed protein product [Cyprideis torosa]|uniref:Uncharacterized protein n=1 Tax=Cyprideis torosa TaxID=163714 RepID=A0A7R8WNZ0_9CRUS|nr:unnamed protein product [Cyprideis torosa]CAG0901173.1 unnamed protein product [Cyprideis torosa]
MAILALSAILAFTQLLLAGHNLHLMVRECDPQYTGDSGSFGCQCGGHKNATEQGVPSCFKEHFWTGSACTKKPEPPRFRSLNEQVSEHNFLSLIRQLQSRRTGTNSEFPENFNCFDREFQARILMFGIGTCAFHMFWMIFLATHAGNRRHQNTDLLETPLEELPSTSCKAIQADFDGAMGDGFRTIY